MSKMLDEILEQIKEIRLALGGTIILDGKGVFSDPKILSIGRKDYGGDFIDHAVLEAVFIPSCSFRAAVHIATGYECTIRTKPYDDWIDSYELIKDALTRYDRSGIAGIKKLIDSKDVFVEKRPSDDFTDEKTTSVNTGNYQKIKSTPSDD